MRIANTMNGKHNLDVGLLVEPLLVKFISATAESLDVPYKLGDVDLEEEAAEKENARISMLIDSALSKTDKTSKEDEGVALMQEIAKNIDTSKEDMPEGEEVSMDDETPVEGAPTDQTPMDDPAPAEPDMQEEQPATPQGAGLMARG